MIFAAKSRYDSKRRTRGLFRATNATKVILVEVNDFDLMIDVVERDRIIRPVQLVVIDRALVVTVDKLAGSGQRIDLGWIDLLTDFLDQLLRWVS
jgi:hypothetical protein